jgi:hypothetical protein
MGRDLLYKPPVPVVQPEEAEGEGKAKAGQKPSRDLGGVGKTFEAPAGYTAPPKNAAFKAAYFNRDTSGLGQANLRQSAAQALRGSESAVDLKKVVLPPPVGVSSPDPAQLRGATDLMALDGTYDLGLETLLGRQSAWARGKTVTVEALKARLAQLEQMVEDRRRALSRMPRPDSSVTVDQALRTQGRALETGDDVVDSGRTLVRSTAAQAEGMHTRIAKMLGIKRPPK